MWREKEIKKSLRLSMLLLVLLLPPASAGLLGAGSYVSYISSNYIYMHIQCMHICINSTNYKVDGFRYRRRKLRCATFQVKNIFLLP